MKCFTYRCTIFLHWVSHFVILVFSSFAREEARLAHVEVEALQAAIPETLELERKQKLNLPRSIYMHYMNGQITFGGQNKDRIHNTPSSL
jgi:hypothetical protein